MSRLSVVVPFHLDEGLPHLLPRLRELCLEAPKGEDIEFLVVDSSPDESTRALVREACGEEAVRYVCAERGNAPFSIGRARDVGATFAKGEALTFFDVDLWVAPDFWPRLLAFMTTFGIARYKKRFFSVPCLYLSQQATSALEKVDISERATHYMLAWLRGDRLAVETFAPCSSMMVVDRLHYLSLGGHDQRFEGHGYEDFEFYFRLALAQSVWPIPDALAEDTRDWESHEYRGFRALFSLFGRPALFQNLVCLHRWHPRPSDVQFYSNLGSNEERLRSALSDVGRAVGPTPLACGERRHEKTLFLSRPGSRSSETLRDALPLLGEMRFADEWALLDERGRLLERQLAAAVQAPGVARVLFPNPYRNEARRLIYQWCRREGIPYLVFERGALPESWFFDANGFLADSSSYDRALWDKPLSLAQQASVRAYIDEWRASGLTLEAQGARLGVERALEELTTARRKILFVPLQRPSDTTTTFFAGAIGGWQQFVSFLDQTARYLKPKGWDVLAKVHPYESEAPKFQNVRVVRSDCHIVDLLDVADAVAVMNSSVGLYACMLGKPCFVFSRSFYNFHPFATSVSEICVEAFCEQVLTTTATSETTALERFVHYLRNQHYSFGGARYDSWHEGDRSVRKAATTIDFYELRVPRAGARIYERDDLAALSHEAPLFERYQPYFRSRA